jgi:protein phosphatase PTC7
MRPPPQQHHQAGPAFSSRTSEVEQQDLHPDEDRRSATSTSSGSGSDSEDDSPALSKARPRSKKSDRPNHNSKITAAQIVKQRQRKVCQINSGATLEDAIKLLASNNSSSSMVYDEKVPGGPKEVVGIFTARDVIKKLNKHADKSEALRSTIKQVMTPMSRVIFCSPDETVEKIQYIMVELKIRTLPVVKDGVIHGIITLGDVINHHYSSEEIGGKKAFIKGVVGRLGLPTGTRVASHVVKEGVKRSIKWKVGMAALPHPFKRPDGVAPNLRLHGPAEYATDLEFSEDASFVLTLPWLHEHGDQATYVGIADGVGSWREHGVDPREYSHRLMELSEEFIRSMAPKAPNLMAPIVRPLDVLSSAWEAIAKEGVVGSSTACIATLDMELNQLSFCNVGDNGIIIMRHIDSDVAGYMRDKTTPRPLRTNDFRIAFVSRQQLRSFNLPYQLGYTNTQPENCFDTPCDADNSSIPVMRGDVIVMATDGLFDNVELDEICSIALAWEKKWFANGAYSSGLRAADFPEESVQELAMTLCKRARELSLDQKRDSPFAILAKENDIMWGGGMPDDCTIVAMRVVKV